MTSTRSIWDGLQQPARRKTGRPPKPVGEPAPRAYPVFTRADPAALAAFDPASKRCTMNCGPHSEDPREPAERKLLCGDCWPVDPA
jgi:hypothetical protein